MFSIQEKITMRAKKHENLIHNLEKNQPMEMRELMEQPDKDTN